MQKFAFFILLGIAFLGEAQAKESEFSILFGPEFTFQVDAVDFEFNAAERMFLRASRHLVDGQPDGAKFSEAGLFGLRSPNGWTFEISPDIQVVEVKMSPLPAEVFRRFKSDMQDAIFASASNENLFPALFLGGGHINIDLETLLERPLLLRNFIVDLFNHSELFLGAFNYDTNNALPFPLFPLRTRLAISEIVNRFDRGEYNGELGAIRFLRELHSAQKDMRDEFLGDWRTDRSASRNKNFAVNFSHVAESGRRRRLEIRGVRPQASMEEWVAQIELLDSRIRYLNVLNRPIPLIVESPLLNELVTLKKHKLTPPAEPSVLIQAFHRYVTEAGEPWEKHRGYLWPKWHSSGALRRCETLLGAVLLPIK